MKTVGKIASAAVGVGLVCSLAANVQAGGVDENMLLELKKLIEQQQKQLDKQAGEIAQLREQLGGAKGEIEKKADKEALEKLDVGKMVTSKFEHVELNLYGHLNRGFLWSDNGDSSKVSFVDNSNSQSRIGIDAAVSPSEGMTVGGRIEYGIKSNATSDISQNETNGATSVNWNLRHADIFFNSKTMGQVSIGHGSAASDGTSEVDLSGTGVVAYSDVAALSGGQYFYDDSTDLLTDTRVKNVFNNMDGLGRDDRLRYDSPSFSGLSFSASAVSGDAYDTAIRYSRAYGEARVGAALAWAKPADSNPTVDNQYDGSMSLLMGYGLNVTFAAGMQELVDDDRDDASFWYGKLGYRFDACSLGTTSFSVDYGENGDVSVNGDEAKTWSVAAVQDMPSWGTEFYLAYRNYSLDSDIGSTEDVNAILGGARVKF
ncbi:MAG: hypothetical protein GY702_21410 [Desulfobulbaceae bacterium]|nr:hypothetical protein [Desulfobulbaceae bacterium]